MSGPSQVFLLIVATLIGGLVLFFVVTRRRPPPGHGADSGSIRWGLVAGLVGAVLLGLGALAVWGYSAPPSAVVDPFNPDNRIEVMCLRLSAEFQRTSSRWAGFSWMAAVLATILSAAGGIIGSGREGESRWYRRGAGVLLASLGSTLAATGAYSVSRSNAASSAAAATTLALREESPARVYAACLEARAQWLQSRVDSLDQGPPAGPKGDGPDRLKKASASDAGAPPVDSAVGPSTDALPRSRAR
jgi:hypothetical protein